MNEAELLFTETLSCNRASLYLERDRPLTLNQAALISSVLERRITGEPIQYILGKTEFMGLEFKVSPNVLIPRPETEVLVETAIRYANASSFAEKQILELGTGSGCVAVSLSKFLPAFKITAIDISLKALSVAVDNAQLNGVSNRIVFLASDLFSALRVGNNKYPICVSNPPYIRNGEIDKLQPEIKYEPRIALRGGNDGLVFYRKIINSSLNYLKDGGFLIMEMGFNQKDLIEKIFQKHTDFKIIEVVKDYNNLERVIVARKGKKRNG